jgi:hypothetical protein
MHVDGELQVASAGGELRAASADDEHGGELPHAQTVGGKYEKISRREKKIKKKEEREDGRWLAGGPTPRKKQRRRPCSPAVGWDRSGGAGRKVCEHRCWDIPNRYTGDVVLNQQARVSHQGWYGGFAIPGGPVAEVATTVLDAGAYGGSGDKPIADCY